METIFFSSVFTYIFFSVNSFSMRMFTVFRQRNKSYCKGSKEWKPREKKTSKCKQFRVDSISLSVSCGYYYCHCYCVDKEMVIHGSNAMALDTLLACFTFHSDIHTYICTKKVIESLYGDNNRQSTLSHSQIYCFSVSFFLSFSVSFRLENGKQLRVIVGVIIGASVIHIASSIDYY